ncbi:MAG: BMC domain-containing protein [Candidatus Marinimicrobia bacterium]|nr:BMC domain-containing protein [Candidatus Neomarinimicrobiota bacterium]
MKKYPAIALIEYSSIAAGILSGDAMVKRAPITVLKAGTVHNGKYISLIGGSVASVEESFSEGLSRGGDQVIDSVILPNVHPQVHDAILKSRKPCSGESLGVIETSTVAATIRSADAGIKGADVNIVEIRLADDIGGKAFALFTGKLEEVEAAVQISKSMVTKPEFWVSDTVIARLHPDMMDQIKQSTRFIDVELQTLEGSEV